MEIEEIFNDAVVKDEYKKALLLNMFKKIIIRMNKQESFRLSIRKLFLQSTNKQLTVKAIYRNHFNFELEDKDLPVVLSWFEANLKKESRRKSVSLELKERLFKKQNGICLACGEPLSNDLSKVHVDHIVPWVLVGDELDNNFQCLCETCNECKSAHTDYMFKNLIKLN